MEDKDRYYRLLRDNRGRLNEIDLGEMMGLTEEEVQGILAQLLAEHRIEYVEEGCCTYRLSRSVRKTKRNQ